MPYASDLSLSVATCGSTCSFIRSTWRHEALDRRSLATQLLPGHVIFGNRSGYRGGGSASMRIFATATR
jgi:hypothetical protein